MFEELFSIRALRISGVAALSLVGLVSCDTTKTTGADSSLYASNGPIDGGYNPYPNGGGGDASGSLLPQSSKPNYQEAPPPPPPGYEKPVVSSEPPAPKPKPKVVASTKETPKPAPKVASSSSSKTKPAASKPATSKTSVASSKPAPKKSSGGGGVHVVVKGDTLYSIARKNDTTVPKLKALNGLTSDTLKLGLKLKLP